MKTVALLPSSLQQCVLECALALAPGHVRRLAESIAASPAFDPALSGGALEAVPIRTSRRHVTAMLDAWSATPAVAGESVAAALVAASDAAAHLRNSQTLDVVWTGPSSPHVPVRATREVLLELIARASESIILVSFAAYKVREMVAALGDAADRGVDIRFVLESNEASQGRLDVDAAAAFRDLADRVRFYEWPLERRRDGGARAGVMHAKAAIIDERVALVTSANLTSAAIASNMELGLLVSGGGVPKLLAGHFRALMGDGVLVEVVP